MMNNICIYVKLKPYVEQWLTSIYGNPVKFPKCSMENDEIRHWLTRVPEGCLPQMKVEGSVAIVLPQSKRRPPEVYNYLTKSAQDCICGMINNNFDSDLKSSVKRSVCNGVPIMKAVRAFMKHHNISLEHDETLRQRINRTVMFYKRKNLNFFFFDAKINEEKVLEKEG